MDEIDDRCVTHHYACDCREAKMAKILSAAKATIENYWYDGIDEMKPTPKCLIDLDYAVRDFEGRE